MTETTTQNGQSVCFTNVLPGEYLLEIDLVTGTMTTPTYVRFSDSDSSSGLPYLVNTGCAYAKDYKYRGYEDAFYHIELSGAAGGNSGYVVVAGSGNGGSKGALGTASVRGTNGITYGIGAQGDVSDHRAYNAGGSGGGGGGGDSWVKGVGGYYIATGGNGGQGISGMANPGVNRGGGGGYGGRR